MRIDILTIFPEIFEGFFSISIIGKARNAGILKLATTDIRDYTTDKHQTVDNTPYGGGAGMIMKIEPIDRALRALMKNEKRKMKKETRRIAVLSARGDQFTQTKAEEYAKLDQLVLICGRYEGIDQRVADHLADEELSIGPYVLAGGEVAALAVIEAVTRLIPGVLGNPESLIEESFGQMSNVKGQMFLEFPQYTKPEEYKGWKVPNVLLSGDHVAIREWRKKQSHTN